MTNYKRSRSTKRAITKRAIHKKSYTRKRPNKRTFRKYKLQHGSGAVFHVVLRANTSEKRYLQTMMTNLSRRLQFSTKGVCKNIRYNGNMITFDVVKDASEENYMDNEIFTKENIRDTIENNANNAFVQTEIVSFE
jgi:hypothetical protein